MSAIENSIQYTGDNSEELKSFLMGLTPNDTVNITNKEGVNEYKVLVKNDITILLQNKLNQTNLNIVFSNISTIVDENTLFTIPNDELVKEVQDIPSDTDEDENIEDSEDIDLFKDDNPDENLFTIVNNNIEEEIIEKKEALSKWEQKLSVNENRQALVDIMNEIYNQKKDSYSVFNEVDILLDLQKKDSKKTNMELRPLLQKIIDNKFNETNIKPIVSDIKKYYDQLPQGEDMEESLKKFIEVDLVNNELDTDEEDKNYGELHILVELLKQYSKKSKKIENDFSFKKFLELRYNGGKINFTDEEDQKDIYFESLELDYLPTNDDNINNTFYKTIINDSIKVMRNCYGENDISGCISDPSKNMDDEDENILSFVQRKTAKPQYILEDILDDIFISSNKHKIKTCNGTNKTGDMFYYGTNKQHDFNRSQSKPPKKHMIFEGEEVKIIGIYIQSPHSKNPNILLGTEYTDSDNNKHYNSLLSKSYDISAILDLKKTDKRDIIIVENYLDFSYRDYDPHKDYFILFNKNKEIINKETYNEYLSRLLPSITNIFDIESNEINKCTSINDIEKIINRYGIYFKELPYNQFNKLKTHITKNIAKLNKKTQTQKLIYLTNKSLSRSFKSIYNQIVFNKLKLELELSDNLLNNYNVTRNLIKNSILSLLETIFEDNDSNDFIYIFITKYLSIVKNVNIDDKTQLYNTIIDYFFSKPINIYKSIADIIYNNELLRKYIEDKECLELIDRYIKVNQISLEDNNSSKNTKFPMSNKSDLNLIYNLKKLKFNGEELLEILSLLNIKKINKNIQTILDNPAYTSKNILKTINNKIKEIKSNYNKNIESYKRYINKCNNVKVVKFYSSLEDLTKDNNKDILVDIQFDQLLDDFLILYNILKTSTGQDINIVHIKSLDNYTDIIEKFKEALHYNYIYLSESDIEAKLINIDEILDVYNEDLSNDYEYFNLINLLENIDKITIEDKHALRDINYDRFVTKVFKNDLALLEKENSKYLFHRINKHWIAIDKESYNNIDKYFKYHKSILMLSYDNLETICSSNEKSGEDDKCVKLGEYRIPKNAYKLHKYIQSLENKRDKLAKIIQFNQTNKLKLDTLRHSINNKLNIVERINKRTYEIVNYKLDKNENKLRKPSLKIQKIFNNIFAERDFDYRMEKLFKFIDDYGIDHNTNISPTEPEGNPDTAKFIYYDSTNIDVPICCKHYLMYKTCIYADNKKREEQLIKLKQKWGIKEDEYYICKNCGEPIDFIKYSEFEGFGRDNKIINVREAVSEDFDEDNIDITDTSSQTIQNILLVFQNILNINLHLNDYNFILKSSFEDREQILNAAQFYSKLKNGDIKLNYFSTLVDNCFKKVNQLLQKKKKNISRDKFNELFNDVESGFIKFAPLMGERIGSLLPYHNFRNNIKNYIQTLGKDKIKQLIVSQFLGNFILRFYVDYYHKSLFEIIIAYLSQVLIYGIPIYRLLGTGAERKAKTGIVIANLYENKEFAVLNIVQKIRGEIKNSLIGDKVTAYLKYYKSLDYTLEEQSISNINNLVLQIVNKPYLRELILKRDEFEAFNLDDLQDISYNWGTFLPYLTVNSNYEYEMPVFENLIDNYRTNLELIKNSVNSDEIILKSRENISIINMLNNIYNSISTLYFTKINNIISEIDGRPYKLSNYTSSIDFSKVNRDYIDSLIQKDSTLVNIKSNLDKLYKFILSVRDNDTSKKILFIKNNIEPRNLQSYMKFDPSLYNNDSGRIKNYLLEKLKQINSILVLEEGENQYKKRYFKFIRDSDYNLLHEIYNSLSIESSSLELNSDFVKDKLRQLLVEKYGSNLTIDFKIKIICDHGGTGYFDMTTKKYKIEIDQYIEQFKEYTITDLLDLLARLNTTFNNQGLIYKNNYSQVEKINCIDRSLFISFRLEEFIRKFNNIYSPEGLEPSIEQDDLYTSFKAIQEKLAISGQKFNNYSDIDNSNIYKVIDDSFDDTQEILEKFKELLKKSPGVNLDIDTFSNIFELNEKSVYDNYFTELSNGIKQQLKVEDILDKSTINTETKFRKNRLEANKYNSLMQFYINCIENLMHKTLIYRNCYISKDHIQLNDSNKYALSLDSDLRKHLQDILRPKIIELNTVLESLSENSECELDLEINYNKINEFLESINSLNNILNTEGEIVMLNILKPDIVIIFLQDILARIIGTILEMDNNLYNNLLIDFYNETVTITNKFINLSDEEIFESIKLKRAKENLNRKKRFDKLSDELKHTQKLYRRFNLGNLFDIDEDIDLNVFNGDNLAEIDNLDVPDLLLDEGATGQADENEALALQTDYNQDI